MKIKIKGVDYTVRFVKCIDEDGCINGQTRYNDKTILIKLGVDDALRTISHEIFHATLYECGLRDDAFNEDMVYWLGYHFESVGFNVLFLLSKYDKKYLSLLKEIQKKYTKGGE